MNRIALITGATAGIGKAIVEKFASEKESSDYHRPQIIEKRI